MFLEIRENEPLKNHSTFRIGGEARFFCVAKSKEEILEAVDFAKNKNLPLLALGGGSNILFKDEGFDGLVMKIQDSRFKIQDKRITAGSGIFLSQLMNVSIQNNLAGLEWAVGIPGTVGGGVNGNCGAYGHSLAEIVEKVTVLAEDGSIKEYTKEECKFTYRKSRFKTPTNKDVILEIDFKFEQGDGAKSREEIKNILEKRKGRVPLQPSAGSVFKNIILDEMPAGQKESFLAKIPQDKIIDGKFGTGWLIDQCGLKGKEIGGAHSTGSGQGTAKISDLHANFIVNMGGAKAADVLALISECKEKVLEKFGIELKEEIVIV